MIKRLLVPIDGSPCADSALRIASSLAGISGAALLGIYIEDPARFLQDPPLGLAMAENITGEAINPFPLEPPELMAEMEQVEKEADELQNSFSRRCNESHIKFEFRRERGNPAEVIIELARSVDFVVIGNNGKHAGVSNKPSGITTDTLLHSTTRPVLVVPAEPQGESRIVIAYDSSVAADRVVRAAAEFAELADMSEVHLVTVSNDREEAEKLQKPIIEYLNAYQLEVKAIVLTGKPSQAILKYTTEVDASVLAVGAYGPNRLREKFFGSTTSSILKESTVAVLLSA